MSTNLSRDSSSDATLAAITTHVQYAREMLQELKDGANKRQQKHEAQLHDIEKRVADLENALQTERFQNQLTRLRDISKFKLGVLLFLSASLGAISGNYAKLFDLIVKLLGV